MYYTGSEYLTNDLVNRIVATTNAEENTLSYKLTDVVHETKNYFILKVEKKHSQFNKENPNGKYICYEIYKNGITCATRCAIVGTGLENAIKECDRREEIINKVEGK